jgi:colanic acid biosynthesis glycosyl transferase WcaI
MRSAQPKLIFINRYFYPDHSATSQMLTDLAFGLAKMDNQQAIHIVTSRQRYDDASAKLLPLETVNDVTIHRIATTRFGRQNLMGRAIDYLSFYISAFATNKADPKGRYTDCENRSPFDIGSGWRSCQTKTSPLG